VHQLGVGPVTRRQAVPGFGSSFDLLNGFLEMTPKVSDDPVQLDVADHVHRCGRICYGDVDATIALRLNNNIAEQH